MKKILLLIFVLILLVLTACSKTNLGEVKSDEESPALDTFCERLSKCEEALLDVKMSDTSDVYNLAILGLDRNTCVLGVTLQKAQTSKLKNFEKLNAVCDQEWSEKFEKIAEFKGEKCNAYTNMLLVNLITQVSNAESKLCYGPLRDKIISK